LTTGNLTDLKMLGDSQRLHALKGLTTLSKFLGICEDFRRLVKNYGLKCSDKNSDELIINRLIKSINPDEIFQWIKRVKACMPELSDFMDFLTVTGLRFIEAVESYNLIISLSKQGKLGEYFNAERQILEHFKFKDIFIRKSKKVFITFVPEQCILKITKHAPIDYDKVKKVVARKVGKLRFADIRELHASVITEYLRQPEIDFLHGRINSSIFMQNYFNPMWIKGLKGRAFKAIEKISRSIY